MYRCILEIPMWLVFSLDNKHCHYLYPLKKDLKVFGGHVIIVMHPGV